VAKIKKSFSCSDCGAQSPKWIGKCPTCGNWNTYQEEIVSKLTKQEQKTKAWKNPDRNAPKPIPLKEIKPTSKDRLASSHFY